MKFSTIIGQFRVLISGWRTISCPYQRIDWLSTISSPFLQVRSYPKICSEQAGFQGELFTLFHSYLNVLYVTYTIRKVWYYFLHMVDETALSTLQRNLLGSSFLQLLRWPQHEPSAFKISKTQNLHIAFLRFVLYDWNTWKHHHLFYVQYRLSNRRPSVVQPWIHFPFNTTTPWVCKNAQIKDSASFSMRILWGLFFTAL